MAHFAQLDANNVVTQVIVVNNSVIEDLSFPESEPLGVAFCQSLFGIDTVWKQTSYNANFRGIYAGIGYTYDVATDTFVAPEPNLSENQKELLNRFGKPIPITNDLAEMP